MPPHITVLMSVHNSGQHLAEAIESILAQTFPDFEFVIINDAATDASREIVCSFSDKRIRLIDNDKNLGLSASLNKGMALAQGVYIARMDADDIALPKRLARQVAFMERTPDIDVCATWYELFGDRVQIVKTPVEHQAIKDTLFFKNCIAHSTVCMKKRSLEQCAGPYDAAYTYAQDYELWCRAVKSLKFATIPEVLLQYRVHGSQAGTRHIQKQDMFADNVRRRNLEGINVRLPGKEEKIYFGVASGRFEPIDKEDILLATGALAKIYSSGTSSCGHVFREMVRKFMGPLLKKSIALNVASPSLFVFFLKAGVFETNRDMVRYIYQCLKNLTGIRKWN